MYVIGFISLQFKQQILNSQQFNFLDFLYVCANIKKLNKQFQHNFIPSSQKNKGKEHSIVIFTALLLGSIFSHTSQPVCEIKSPPTQITTNCDRAAHTNSHTKSHAHAYTQPSVLNQPKRQLFKRTMPSFRKQKKPSFTSRPNSKVKILVPSNTYTLNLLMHCVN